MQLEHIFLYAAALQLLPVSAQLSFSLPAATIDSRQSTAASTGDTGPAAPSSRPGGKLVYIFIITALTLLAIAILFWLYLRNRRRRDDAPPPSPDFKPAPETFQSRLVSAFVGWTMLSGSRNEQPKDAEKGIEVHVTEVHVPESPSVRQLDAPSTFPYPVPEMSILQRRMLEEAQHARRASQKTILAELEGDNGPVPDLPTPHHNPPIVLTLPDGSIHTQITIPIPQPTKLYKQQPDPSSRPRPRATVLSEGQPCRVVKGREGAAIVAVRRRADSDISAVPAAVGRLARSLDDARVVELADEVFLRECSVALQTMDCADREDRARKERRRRKREERKRGGGSTSMDVSASVSVVRRDGSGGVEEGVEGDSPLSPPLSALGPRAPGRPTSI